MTDHWTHGLGTAVGACTRSGQSTLEPGGVSVGLTRSLTEALLATASFWGGNTRGGQESVSMSVDRPHTHEYIRSKREDSELF